MNAAQQPDSKPGAYYVSVVRDGGDWRPLLGPFMDDHAGALAMVDKAREKAQEMDPKAVWYSFGTVRVPMDSAPLLTSGIMNKFFNMKEIAS